MDVPRIPPDNEGGLGLHHLLLFGSLTSMGQRQSEECPVSAGQ